MSDKASEIANKLESPEQSKEVAPKQPPKNIAGFLAQYQKQIASVLPKHITPERMSRIALSECRKTPDLYKCDPSTLFAAIVTCSQLGLEPGSERGLAYLLPFRNTKLNTVDVQLIIGYKGFVEMGWRSGMIKSIDANPVYENDEFDFQFGTDPFIRHKPLITGDRGKLVAAYCAIKTANGGSFFKVVTRQDVDRAKSFSKSAGSQYSPWSTSEADMWVKTAIRRAYKLAPMSPEIQKAVHIDEMAEAGDQHEIFDAEFHIDETDAAA